MKNRAFQVGITGGIGAGKSIICQLFKLLGIPVYDADSRAKWLMNHDPALKDSIKQTFGEGAYNSNGQLDRRYLAQKVFSKGKEEVQKLNQLVHPRVGEDSQQWAMINADKAPYLLREAALLFESKAYLQMQKNITVFAPDSIRIERVKARDPQRSKDEIQQIINKQLPEKKRQEYADFILYNDGSQMLIPQVIELHHQLVELAAGYRLVKEKK